MSDMTDVEMPNLRCPNCGASASLPLGSTCDDHRPVPVTGGAVSGTDTTEVTLAQIVAALSVTYTDEGVLIWLESMHRDGIVPIAVLRQGRFQEVAEKVRRIGDADPSDFTVTEARS